MSEIITDPKSVEDNLVTAKAQNAYFLDDCVKVTLNNGIEKVISYESLLEIFKTMTNSLEEDTALDGVLLPNGTFYLAKSSDAIKISCYYPSGVYPLKYYDNTFNIITPNIIISHTLRKGATNKEWSISGSRYFCTDLPVGGLPKEFIYSVTTKNRIYLLPMSNTYSEGTMCYGGNTMPGKFIENNLRGLDWYFKYLWASPFNDDLGIRATNSSISPKAWYLKLKSCADNNSPFPYNELYGFSPR